MHWDDLTDLTQGRAFTVERVRLTDSDIALEGRFEPSPLACLSAEDQVFVIYFVRCFGSIKQMEAQFGASYPTIKARLARIGEQIAIVPERRRGEGAGDPIDDLVAGRIDVDEALARLTGHRDKATIKGDDHE
ncbi:hypothetical protein CCR80_09715 [Rhodothalassium salexigens]|uniref:DUF2089 family protein n=1 Tax=Rhodothalassium salexigens TaxID=1086 RepID=UPI0019127776|nr:DUF2089 family protein [Rhodothalassium salexigens]MBK5921304.1 hypothetical protein [Rhodothalassium salexigens]